VQHKTFSELTESSLRMNPHIVGILLKELVRRAMEAIRGQRFIFEATPKDTPGRTNDLVTSADLAAQEIYVRGILECLPGAGIVGEEHDLLVECTLEGDLELYVFIDPLDGTKAFARRQAHGVATQIALGTVDENRDVTILAAFVGDVSTGEIYGFRPDGKYVHRITNLVASEHLSKLKRKPPQESLVVSRQHPDQFSSKLLRWLLRPQEQGGLCRDLLITNGSATLTAAHLWRGEAAVQVSEPFRETPWDLAPLVGIYRRLGFVPLRVTTSGDNFIPYDMRVPLSHPRDRIEPIIWVHAGQVQSVQDWALHVPWYG